MPLYEFQCDACGREFEELVAGARARPVCPKCGSGKLKKKFSAFSAAVASGNPCEAGACPSGAGGGGCGCSGACPHT